MKALKIYFIVATCMLFIALGTGVYVWYTYQTLARVTQRDTNQQPAAVQHDVVEQLAVPEKEISTPEPVPVSQQASSTPITIDATKLTPAQRDILKSFGYASDSITVTESVITCAETAVGNERFARILGGTAPTPLEALRMLPCMQH
jgi:hypothetical protein